MNIDPVSLAVIISLIAAGAAIRYSMLRRIRKNLARRDESINEFMANFDPSHFNDFSAFSFIVARESLIEPFPIREDGEWRHVIRLSPLDVEDLVTITHEIAEFTIGRLIERLLNLEKSLFLKRKEEDVFWIKRKNGNYVLEHFVATLSEIGQVEKKQLEERLSREDLEEAMKWINQ